MEEHEDMYCILCHGRGIVDDKLCPRCHGTGNDPDRTELDEDLGHLLEFP